MKTTKKTTILATFLLSSALISSPVLAAETSNADADTSAASDDNYEGAIIVTARKRQETLLDVPIAVSAFNSAALEDRMVQDVSDISAFTPGFQINESFGRDSDRPVMRGASNILFADGKVGVFVDGIPYFGDFSSLDVGNAERVEVIKGPQSAVFGRGTLSGAINVIMKRPSDHFEGRISATAGNFNHREISGAVSGPIAQGVSFQVGAKYFDVDGQYRNSSVPGERLGDQNTKQLNAALYLDPTDNLSASLRWIHQTDRDSHFAIALQDSSNNNCFLETRGYYCGTVKAPTQFGLNTDRLELSGLSRKADRFLGDIAWDIAGSGYEASFQVGVSKVREVVGVDQTYDDRFFAFLAPATCLQRVNRDCSKSSFETTDGTRRKTQTYEWRLSSPSTDSVRWRAGLFHSYDISRGMTEWLELSELGPELLTDTRRVKNTAFFGGVDVDVTHNLTASAELRHQIDKVSSITPTYRVGDVFDASYLASLPLVNADAVVGVAGQRNATFKATLPRFMLNWKVDNRTSFYAQYSQGNSPGGFNKTSAPSSVYQEEELINYEVGVKTSRLGFDYLNLSAFWQNYKNQVLTNTYVANQIVDSYNVNIGRTRIRGIELDGQLPLIGKMLKLQFNYSYLDANIRKGIEPEKAVQLLGADCKTGSSINLSKPGCFAAADISGNRPPLVSKHTGTVGLRFREDVGDGWEIFSGADLIYRSSWYAQVLNLAESGSSTRVNLQFGAENADGLRIAVYGRNIFSDKTPTGILRYLDFPAAITPSGDYARAFGISPARKPEYGITLSRTF